MKAIIDRPAPISVLAVGQQRRSPACFCVTEAPPRTPPRQGQQLGDFIRGTCTAKSQNKNRFQPLTMAADAFWKDIGEKVQQQMTTTDHVEDFPPLPG